MKRDYVASLRKPDAPTAVRNLAVAFEHEERAHALQRFGAQRVGGHAARELMLGVRLMPSST
jgi:hypothetical protein